MILCVGTRIPADRSCT